jgi:hypothetical protein
MTPDELRQLADRLDRDHRVEPDPASPMGGGWDRCARCRTRWPCDPSAAAVALRHHANLTDAIGDPDDLTFLAGLCIDEATYVQRHHAGLGESVSALSQAAVALQRVAHAAAVSPTPAPTTCPTCGSDDKRTFRTDRGCQVGYGHPWHQATT